MHLSPLVRGWNRYSLVLVRRTAGIVTHLASRSSTPVMAGFTSNGCDFGLSSVQETDPMSQGLLDAGAPVRLRAKPAV